MNTKDWFAFGVTAGALVAIVTHPLGCILALIIILLVFGIPLLIIGIFVATHLLETLIVIGLLVGLITMVNGLTSNVGKED